MPTRVCIVRAMVFPIVMYGCESWIINKAEYWRIYAFKLWCWRRLESPLYSKKIKSVNPKRNQPWLFTVRSDAEAEAPILWPSDAKSQFIGKDPDAGKDWGQEKGTIEDEMVRWHDQLGGHEFEQTPRDGKGQGSLVCCSPWGHKELDLTEKLSYMYTYTYMYIYVYIHIHIYTYTFFNIFILGFFYFSKFIFNWRPSGFLNYLFIWLSCGTWALPSSLWHAKSFSCAMWDLAPWPGIEPRPPALGVQSLSHWKHQGSPYPFICWWNILLPYLGHCK